MSAAMLFQMIVIGMLTAFGVVRADLAAALRKKAASSHGQSPAAQPLPLEAPLDGPVAIPLKHTTARNGAIGSFYMGQMTVGHPEQLLSVIFDTASGSVILPHRACKSQACVEHRRYSSWESSTAMDVLMNGEPVVSNSRLAPGNIQRDGATVSFTQADLGVGDVHAALVRDGVCLQGSSSRKSCVDMSVLAAVELDAVPFRAIPSDAIIGMGLEQLTLSPLCSFLGRLFEGSKNVQPQFGMSLHPDSGELYLGGYNEAMLAAPLVWLDVDHPEAAYWQVAIQAVRVGNRTVESCSRGCHAVIDTASSRLGVQQSKLPALKAALRAKKSSVGVCEGPELHFDLGSITITLKPEDYSDSSCAPQLGKLDLDDKEFVGVYTFGEKVLRRYYAAFDWEKKRVGFAPARRSIVKPNVIFT